MPSDTWHWFAQAEAQCLSFCTFNVSHLLYILCHIDQTRIIGIKPAANHCYWVSLTHLAVQPSSSTPAATQRKFPPQIPVGFPQCAPRTDEKPQRPLSEFHKPLVDFLQGIHRPGDISLDHFEALGLHVISDSKPQDIIPESNYLPPVTEWNAIESDNLPEANHATKKPLSNGNISPGVQTYRERQDELRIDNTAAFRSIRRIPPPTGASAVRLGNAYEFFKNLEFFSGYWDDTSLPPKEQASEATSSDDPLPSSEDSANDEVDLFSKEEPVPAHLSTHQRTGNGSQLPPEYRQNLLTSFVKLVAYDFGCNVSLPRSEPRLYLAPSALSKPTSYFNSSAIFIFRTPTDRSSARGGIVEGPVAAISCRASTVFATEAESRLDLAREVVAVLLTAQHRSREDRTEKRFGENQWWSTKPRWGGGPGGPIGKEADKSEESSSSAAASASALATTIEQAAPPSVIEPVRSIAAETRRMFGISGPPERSRRGKRVKDGNMQIYENYRKMLPPSATWDRRTRYMTIGKPVPSQGYDDIFLVSALNHHVSILRVRVPEALLQVLDGGDNEWERVVMWRSKWYDLFLADDRVEAMQIIWGMMAFQMRTIDVPATESRADGVEKMDTS
jgi:hypothetical protein